MTVHSSSDSQSQAAISIIAATARYSRLGIVATLLTAPVVVLVLWPHLSDRTPLIAWFITIMALAALRLTQKTPEAERMTLVDASRLQRRLRIGLTAAGVLWGSIALILPRDLPAEQLVIVLMVLGGMIAGASTAFSGLKELAPLFCIGAFIGLEIGLYQMTAPAPWLAMGAAVVFQAMMLQIALRNGRLFRSLVLSRAEHLASTERLNQSVAENEMLAADARINQGLFAEALEDLQRQDLFMEKVLQSSPVALIVIDEHRRVIFSGGRAFSEMSLLEGTTIDDLPEPLNDLHRLIDNRRHTPILTELNNRQLEWVASPMQNHALAEPLVALTGVDVSESSRLRLLQTAFVRSVNHRLRNPLAKCKGAFDLLKAALGTEKQWVDLVEMGERGVGELEEIVQRINTLDALTADTSLPNLSAVPTTEVRQMVESAYNEIAASLRKASGLEWISIKKGAIEADARILRAVLNELVHNAAIHCQPGSKIEVEVSLPEYAASINSTAPRAILTIRNQVANDWEPVMKIPDDAAPYHGLRLGTVLCRRAVENLRGEFALEINDHHAIAQIQLPVVICDPATA